MSITIPKTIVHHTRSKPDGSPSLDIYLYTRFIDRVESRRLYQETRKYMSSLKKISLRRTNVTLGDEGVSYEVKFKNNTVVRYAEPWSNIPSLLLIKKRVEEITRQTINYVVIQHYPNGNVGIAPHQDKENDPTRCIAGLSIGATRVLQMGPPRYSEDKPLNISSSEGSLYVLWPPTNNYGGWTHSIVVDPEVIEPRFSFTFR